MLIGGARHARFRQSFDARLSIARLDFSRCGNPRRPRASATRRRPASRRSSKLTDDSVSRAGRSQSWV